MIIISQKETGYLYLSQNILRLRVQKSMTKEQLAAAIGVSTKTICNLEQGQFGKRLGVQYVFLIADALGCDASVLFLPPPDSTE